MKHTESILLGANAYPRGSFLSAVHDSELAELRSVARSVSFGDGHAILCQGDSGDRVFVLLGGAAKVAVTTVDGNRVLLGLRTRGDLVGELRLLTQCRRVASVYAAGPVWALAVEFRVMRAWLDRHPRLGIALAESVARGLLWADQRRCDFTRPVRDRVRSLLGDLADALGAAGEAPPSVVPLVQREIAELVGAAEVSVQKAIRELAEEGWLTRRYKHVILNPQRIAACSSYEVKQRSIAHDQRRERARAL